MQKVDVVDVYNNSTGVIFKFRMAWKEGTEEKHTEWTGDFKSGDYGHLDMNNYASIPAGTTVWPQIDAKGAVTNPQEPNTNDYIICDPKTENVATYGVTGTVNKLNIVLFK